MLIFDLPHLSIYSKSHKSFKSSGCQREREREGGRGGGEGEERGASSLFVPPVKSFIEHRGCWRKHKHIRCSHTHTHTHTHCFNTHPLNLSQLPPRGSSCRELFTLTSETFPRRFTQTHRQLQSQTRKQRTAASLLPSHRLSSAGCAAPLLRSGSCFSTVESSTLSPGNREPVSPRIDQLQRGDHTQQPVKWGEASGTS